MKVHPIESRDGRRSAFHASMEELVLSAGSGAFEPALFASAREATGCEHLTAYTFSASDAAPGGPNLVLAANPGRMPIAREAGEIYVSRFWDRDPGNRVCREADHAGAGVLIRASGDDIRNAPFRQGCYSASTWEKTGNRMIDRVSIVKRQRGRYVKLSFHRAEWAGLFSDREIGNIVEVADLLTALVARHDAALPATGAGTRSDHARYVEAVHAVCPQLTEREAEICARIALGISSEGMALDLDISINTVRTYRKRAYTRLNISSQNELMKLVLPYVATH